ncbi:MAG: response regulator [Candidatus Krumholzibacteriia bacterium]
MEPAPGRGAGGDRLRGIGPVLVLCALILGVASAASFLNYRQTARVLRERANQSMAQEVASVKAGTDQAVSTWFQNMVSWAAHPVMIQIVEQDVDHQIEDLLDAITDQYGDLKDLACFTASGKLLAWAGTPRADFPLDVDAELLEAFRHGRRAAMELTGDEVAVSVPIFWVFDEREILGVLRATLPPAAFLVSRGSWWTGLATETGRVLEQRGPELPGHVSLDVEQDEVPDVGSVVQRAASVEFPAGVVGPQWHVLVAQRHDVLYGPIGVLRTMAIWLTAAASLVMLLVVVGFVWEQRKFITRLAEHTRELEKTTSALQAEIRERERVEAELQEAKEAAEAATRAKGQFLANMSHEIRTPMNPVVGMTELLLDTELTTEQRDYVETIQTSAEALLTIINDILDFSKIDSGMMNLENEPLDVAMCVESSLNLLAGKAAEKEIDLAYTIEQNTPIKIRGDATRLRQILTNLIGNAVKFTERGEIEVVVSSKRVDPEAAAADPGDGAEAGEKRSDAATEEHGGTGLVPALGRHEIHFAVRDTGIGIPKDRMDRLFKSFSQVDDSTTRQYGGTGLGLAISKRLCELMDGRMWVESEPGRGSTFHFTVVARGAPGTAPCTTDPGLANKHVLIVDDNATIRRTLVLLARSWGMIPRAAASGPAALAWIRDGARFDVAILDTKMPEMDGLTLAAEIRNHVGAEELPLVMLAPVGRHRGDPAISRFAGLVTKPVRPSQMFDELIGILDSPPTETTQPTRRPREAAREGKVDPLRILLAEDNVVNQKVALRILERLGYKADVVSNGMEAIRALDKQTYDVVLMDMQMPVMDGSEATRKICVRWPRGQRPRIIAMTANAMQGDREACLAAGMDDYISKPVQIQRIQEALQRCRPLDAPRRVTSSSDSI